MAQRTRGLLPGTVDLVILQTLTQSALHGFAISRSIRARSDGALELQDAALYQALHRCESKGWIEAEWGLSENNRRAKFYRVTRKGSKHLQSAAATWRQYAKAVFKVLDHN